MISSSKNSNKKKREKFKKRQSSFWNILEYDCEIQENKFESIFYYLQYGIESFIAFEIRIVLSSSKMQIITISNFTGFT